MSTAPPLALADLMARPLMTPVSFWLVAMSVSFPFRLARAVPGQSVAGLLSGCGARKLDPIGCRYLAVVGTVRPVIDVAFAIADDRAAHRVTS